MTKLGQNTRGNIFNHLLIAGLLSASFLQTACAPQKTSADILTEETIQDSAEIIGGDKVDKNSAIGNKVLYLAYDVKLIQANGTTRVTWGGHCTASALSTRVILTAAHCVHQKPEDEVYITLTTNPESSPLNIKEWIKAKRIRVHEGYQGEVGHYANDLALILLDKALPANRVAKLANANQVHFPQGFVAAGYGVTTDRSDIVDDGLPSELRYVAKTLVTINFASKTFSINQNDHKGFCRGDSGGPGIIIDPQTKELFVLGVVSNTSMLNSEDQVLDPQGIYSLCIGTGNYTNTLNPEFRLWIESHIKALEASSS